MYYKEMCVGDLHADLWEKLAISSRLVDGPQDVTVGEHPDLGRCIVSQYGREDRAQWWTERPILTNATSPLEEALTAFGITRKHEPYFMQGGDVPASTGVGFIDEEEDRNPSR